MREIKFRAVMQRLDGVKYVSQAYSIDNNLSYLFDFENNRWDIFLEMITTEERFVELFPDDDEHLKGWTHIENIQYTGFKIKNIEIYENDIIRARKNYLYKVVFENGSFVLYHLNKYDGQELICWGLLRRLFDSDMKDILEESEIIGNIYENPELLELE